MAIISLWPLDEAQGTLVHPDMVNGNDLSGVVEQSSDPCTGIAVSFAAGTGQDIRRSSTTSLESGWVAWLGWFHTSHFDTGSGACLFGKAEIFPAAASFRLFQESSPGNHLRFDVRVLVSGVPSTISARWPSSILPGWHLVACYDDGSAVGISIDGGPYVTTPYTGARIVDSGQFAVGTQPGVGSFHWGGVAWKLRMLDSIPLAADLAAEFENPCGATAAGPVYNGSSAYAAFLTLFGQGEDMICRKALLKDYAQYSTQTGEKIWAYQLITNYCADWIEVSIGALIDPSAAAGAHILNGNFGVRVYEGAVGSNNSWLVNTTGAAIGRGIPFVFPSWQSPVLIPWMGKNVNVIVEFVTADTIAAGTILELSIAPIQEGA